MSAATLPPKVAPLGGTDLRVALEAVEAGPDAAASVFLIGALRNPTAGMRAYGWQRTAEPAGVIVLLPRLPPFGVPVILPAGRITAEDLTTVAAREPSPRMALGPAGVVESLVTAWPPGWEPLMARRPEVLLAQPEPAPAPAADERVRMRLARPDDTEPLAGYRIAMERDSGTAIVSTPEEAHEIVRALIAAEALTVVEVDAALSGCAAITSTDERHEQLGFVYVEPRHRLRGISDRLLGQLCRGVHARHRIPICFTEAAGPLSERLRTLGFSYLGEHLKLYFGPP
jgi:GNAT superfamily N-acetyltransferase